LKKQANKDVTGRNINHDVAKKAMEELGITDEKGKPLKADSIITHSWKKKLKKQIEGKKGVKNTTDLKKELGKIEDLSKEKIKADKFTGQQGIDIDSVTLEFSNEKDIQKSFDGIEKTSATNDQKEFLKNAITRGDNSEIDRIITTLGNKIPEQLKVTIDDAKSSYGDSTTSTKISGAKSVVDNLRIDVNEKNNLNRSVASGSTKQINEAMNSLGDKINTNTRKQLEGLTQDIGKHNNIRKSIFQIKEMKDRELDKEQAGRTYDYIKPGSPVLASFGGHRGNLLDSRKVKAERLIQAFDSGKGKEEALTMGKAMFGPQGPDFTAEDASQRAKSEIRVIDKVRTKMKDRPGLGAAEAFGELIKNLEKGVALKEQKKKTKTSPKPTPPTPPPTKPAPKIVVPTDAETKEEIRKFNRS